MRWKSLHPPFHFFCVEHQGIIIIPFSLSLSLLLLTPENLAFLAGCCSLGPSSFPRVCKWDPISTPLCQEGLKLGSAFLSSSVLSSPLPLLTMSFLALAKAEEEEAEEEEVIASLFFVGK